jgi:hypothetical protein
MALQDISVSILDEEFNIADELQLHEMELMTLITLLKARYLSSRAHNSIPKAGNLHLAFIYAEDTDHHDPFIRMLCMTPQSFYHIISLIQDHPAFYSGSAWCGPQAPIDFQLAVTLYWLGRYGNGSGIADVAQTAGIAEGSVINFTHWCMKAILSLELVVM